MNLIFALSLEQRALSNVAVTLWSQNDIRDLMSKYALHILHDNWHEIEKVVMQKSFKLRLPEMLKENLLIFIVRVGLQLLSWVDVHCHYKLVTELPATFVWTSLGTINNMKTAKLLVMGGTLDGDMSFALACMYCLVEEIKYCWNLFSMTLNRSKFNHLSFVPYWFKYLTITEWLVPYSPFMLTPHISFLQEAVESGNEVATRYFFKVNMRDDKEFVMVSARFFALKVRDSNNVMFLLRCGGVMVFLLSKMNAEQKANMIVNYTYALLKCLLMWPWHSLFLEVVIKDKWNSLSVNDYSNLLCIMVVLMRCEHNLHELFGEFWQLSPEAYRQYVTEQGDIVYLLIGLYAKRDNKNLKLILKDISNIKSKPIFVYLISLKKWDSIEFLIQKCLSHWEDLLTFRDVFKNHVQELLSGEEFWKEDYLKVEFRQWNKFFRLVDVSRYNRGKTCTVYNNTSSKNH